MAGTKGNSPRGNISGIRKPHCFTNLTMCRCAPRTISTVTGSNDPIVAIEDVQEYFSQETIQRAKELCDISDLESSRREPNSIAAAVIYLSSDESQRTIWAATRVTDVKFRTARDSMFEALREVNGERASKYSVNVLE